MITTRSTPSQPVIQGTRFAVSPRTEPGRKNASPTRSRLPTAMTLREGGEADAAVVHHADDDGPGYAGQYPARMHLPAGHGVETAGLEAGRQVAEDGRQSDRLEGADRDVGEDQRPAADERPGGSQCDEGETDLAAGARESGRQLRIGEPHQPDHHRAGAERQDRADRAGPDDHLASEDHPAPADHCAEGDGQHVAPAEQLAEVNRWVRHPGGHRRRLAAGLRASVRPAAMRRRASPRPATARGPPGRPAPSGRSSVSIVRAGSMVSRSCDRTTRSASLPDFEAALLVLLEGQVRGQPRVADDRLGHGQRLAGADHRAAHSAPGDGGLQPYHAAQSAGCRCPTPRTRHGASATAAGCWWRSARRRGARRSAPRACR